MMSIMTAKNGLTFRKLRTSRVEKRAAVSSKRTNFEPFSSAFEHKAKMKVSSEI